MVKVTGSVLALIAIIVAVDARYDGMDICLDNMAACYEQTDCLCYPPPKSFKACFTVNPTLSRVHASRTTPLSNDGFAFRPPSVYILTETLLYDVDQAYPGTSRLSTLREDIYRQLFFCADSCPCAKRDDL